MRFLRVIERDYPIKKGEELHIPHDLDEEKTFVLKVDTIHQRARKSYNVYVTIVREY